MSGVHARSSEWNPYDSISAERQRVLVSATAMNKLPEVPNPLASILQRYCNVKAFGAQWPKLLMIELINHKDPQHEKLFRNQIAFAILHSTISPEQYEALTGQDFDTQKDLNEWLRELWKELYGDRSVIVDESE
jgi:hypothetical protein